MADSSDFQPGEKLPTLGVTDKNGSSWSRWVLPIATGFVIALIAGYFIQ